MSNYCIYADSACDLGGKRLKSLNVKFLNLTFYSTNDNKEYENNEISEKEFFNRMRNGEVFKTSAINAEAFKNAFEAELKNGNNIIYLAFSSGLSTTYNSARIAADELSESYPNCKIAVIDTRAASAGLGLIVALTAKKRDEGADFDELVNYATELSPKVCHWFTVDDLTYLKRGGRVSPTVALVGSILGIKPILHCDDDGKLINISKVRGRNASIQALADKIGELAVDATKGPIFICHGDCEKDAKLLSDIIEKKYGLKTDTTVYVGPVIGAHSGPGTLAVFFIGKER